jgi:hypothetical protein
MRLVIDGAQDASEKIVWSLTEFDVQAEALQTLGRILTDEELDIATKAFEWGIGESIRIIYNTIFTEMI